MYREGKTLNVKLVFPGRAISIIKLRRSHEPLVFMMGISTLVKRRLYIETVHIVCYMCYFKAVCLECFRVEIYQTAVRNMLVVPLQ